MNHLHASSFPRLLHLPTRLERFSAVSALHTSARVPATTTLQSAHACVIMAHVRVQKVLSEIEPLEQGKRLTSAAAGCGCTKRRHTTSTASASTGNPPRLAMGLDARRRISAASFRL